MNGPELLEHAAALVHRRRREYGEPVVVFEHIAPKHLDSQVDVAGYAAVLREVSR